MTDKEPMTLEVFKDWVDQCVEEGGLHPRASIATKAMIDGLDKEDLFEALCYASESGLDLEFVRDFPEMEQDYNPHTDPKERRLLESVELFSHPITN